MNRCVIIGAGEIKDYKFIKSLIKDNDTIVCADAGYIHAQRMGLEIECIIGDFDSSEMPEFDNVITLPVEKDVTDTFYCAKTFLQKGCRSFLLLGVTGGRFDHSYTNIQTLYYLSQNGCEAYIVDEKNKIYAVTENEMSIHFSQYENISFFALFDDVTDFEIKNAKYELLPYLLKTYDPLCVSNSFILGKDLFIKKSSGTLLVIESK